MTAKKVPFDGRSL